MGKRDAGQKVTDEGRVVAERIRRALQLARDGPITQAELARRTELPYSRLGHYAQGTRRLPIREAKLIGAATGIPAAFLMGLVDEPDMELLRLPRAARLAMLQMHASMTAQGPKNQPQASPEPLSPFESRPPAPRRRAR
jgi:transcriptional regulator with XRE-family HTH domain